MNHNLNPVALIVVLLANCASKPPVHHPATPATSTPRPPPIEQPAPDRGKTPEVSTPRKRPSKYSHYTDDQVEAEIARLSAKRQRLLRRYTEKHPDVVIIGRDLKDLRTLRTNRQRERPPHPSPDIDLAAPPRILGPEFSGFLPDFSYAGYRWGEEPIPITTGKEFDVSSYGATADDGIDDTEAIKAALTDASQIDARVTIIFPPGRFIVSDVLMLERDNIVLRGTNGENKSTILYFPIPILETENAQVLFESVRLTLNKKDLRTGGRRVSPAAWTGGFIWSRSSQPRNKPLGNALTGTRGEYSIKIDGSAGTRPGDVIQIQWCTLRCNVDGFLRHVFDDQPVQIGRLTRAIRANGIVKQYVTVTRSDGKHITVKEPLLHDIRPEWRVKLATTRLLKRIGIENLTLQFPNVRYAGHLLEAGYNAIYMTDALHSWIDNVTIVNADSAVIMNRCKNVSVQGITTKGRGGHYAVNVTGSSDILVRDFNFVAHSVHGPSTNWMANRTVFTGGRVNNMPIDQHNGLNQQNLFDNLKIRLERADKLFRHGGAKDWRPTAGAFSTFWNIEVKAKRNSTIKLRNAPSARIIGLRGNPRLQIDYGPNAYIERLNQPLPMHPSLYTYQLRNRKKSVESSVVARGMK